LNGSYETEYEDWVINRNFGHRAPAPTENRTKSVRITCITMSVEEGLWDSDSGKA